MSTHVVLPNNTLAARLRTQVDAGWFAVSEVDRKTYRQNNCVPQLVAIRATENPEAAALVTADYSITYQELNDQANQLAHYLATFGIGRKQSGDESNGSETIIAFCLERSPAAVIAALGILKSGAAYLPLDPSNPTERLTFMLKDARPRVLITTGEIARRLPAGPWEVIAIDAVSEQLDAQPTSGPLRHASPDDLAYVIYTSGSTGQPKGVEVTHANLSNLVQWHQRAFAVTENDRASLLAGVAFDAAVWETWPYLTAGATLHLPDEETKLGPELLRDWLARNITISFLPTALAERVIKLEWPANTNLRLLLTGAETLRQFVSADLPFTLVNNYGPTECTVVATSGVVPAEGSARTLPSIGRPISNTEIYILDDRLQPVRENTAGEIFIGGAGVARGYLNRPDLTAERFIPNPFIGDSSRSAERLYRTGDKARYLPGGEIEFLGRLDEQIKILGHRIEPNEIVNVVNRHPAVLASVVVARGEACCEKNLVAYVVLDCEAISAAELRSFVANELPNYMVPSVFVRLAELPLTQNGKVDRLALPVPDVENTLRDQEFATPSTPLELRLAAMLSSLLGLQKVGLNDNFFLLGGHSLLGTQLIAQIRGAFGVEIALRTLFESPTIAQLSTEIERLVTARVEAMSEEEIQRLLA